MKLVYSLIRLYIYFFIYIPENLNLINTYVLSIQNLLMLLEGGILMKNIRGKSMLEQTNIKNLNKLGVILVSIIFIISGFIVVSPRIDSVESFSITWEVEVDFDTPDGSGDSVFFGEAPDANDGPPVDDYDVPHPPPGPSSYIYAWFDDGLPYPFDKLRRDCREYPDTNKTWDLYIKWEDSGSTTVNISWNTIEVIGSGYDDVEFCNNSGTVLRDMTTQSSYSYTVSDGATTHFKIICHKNSPPVIPNNPVPYDGETDVDVDVDLSWDGGDPDGDPVTYDVYFGTTTPPLKQVSNQSWTSWDPGTMDNDETYYWKIVAWDSYDASSVGNEWHFITELNLPPFPPSNPDPYNGETDVEVNADLYWSGGDPDGDPVTYDVYFGTANPPSKASSNQSSNTYDPGTMDVDETYYWKIVAWDDKGESNSGPIWSFSTKSNQPPDFGEPTPINGSADQPVEYLTWEIKIYDIEGDNFNWIIECSSGQSVSGNNDINGTKNIHLSNLDFLTTYTIWVNATDPLGSGTYNNEFFTFTTCDGPFETVYVDDNYHSSTPGFGCDHFITVQHGVDRVDDGGVVYVMDGIYRENILIDERENLFLQGVNHPADGTSIIEGNMDILVDGVTVTQFQFMPSGTPVITVDADDVNITQNIFLKNCLANAVGIYSDHEVVAEYNWWGAPDGPEGGQMDDGATVDGMGVLITGTEPVLVEPFVGAHAEATASTYSVDTGEPVIFDATGSFAADFDGTYSPSYYWTFEPLYHSNEKQPAYVFSSPGTYMVSLRVQGNGINGLYDNFLFDWAYLSIEVNNPTSTLSANGGGSGLGVYETYVDEPITLQGSASGGTPPYSYNWNLGDGSYSSEQNPTHTYATVDVFTVSLTVTDSSGDTAVDTVVVEVYEIGELVVSISGIDTTNVETPVYFNSIISGGVGPYAYAWSFGDGSTSTEVKPTHIYESKGTYTVTLSVTDSRDNVDTATKTIIVESAVEVVEIIDVNGGFGIKAIIKAGDTPVDWTISVDGFVLMGHDASGYITAGTEQIVKIPLTIALGKVDITVTAGSLQETYTAFALGPLFLNMQVT